MHSAVLTLLFKLIPTSMRKPHRARDGKAFIIQYGGVRGSLILHITDATEYHALCGFSSSRVSIGDINLSREYVTYIIFGATVYDCNGNMGYGSGTLWRANVPFASCI